jgi:hypothetical protein
LLEARHGRHDADEAQSPWPETHREAEQAILHVGRWRRENSSARIQRQGSEVPRSGHRCDGLRPPQRRPQRVTTQSCSRGVVLLGAVPVSASPIRPTGRYGPSFLLGRVAFRPHVVGSRLRLAARASLAPPTDTEHRKSYGRDRSEQDEVHGASWTTVLRCDQLGGENPARAHSTSRRSVVTQPAADTAAA